MRNRKLKLGLVAAAAVSATIPLLAAPAFADLAPSTGDAVGVGSDTVQYASDFVADGDFLADAGYNSAGNLNRIVNFDATPDSDARLGYGAPGVGTGTCPPGLGGTAGTGNQTTNHADTVCVLNPTIVLRAGQRPVLRPNGSGAGGKAGAADNGTTHSIDYVRASAAQEANLAPTTTSPKWSSITLGQDPLGILVASTTNAPTVLSVAQLGAIYKCTSTTWSTVGGTATSTIIPIIPQVGSGTRSSFETAIGVTDATLGPCVKVAEENDPFGISNVPASLSPAGSPADAIEPMSGGRLNLFLGLTGSSNGIAGGPNGVGGYFQDPSCPFGSTVAACTGTARTLSPAVKMMPSTGTASDGTAAFANTRNLYLYFRDSDVSATKVFQPGSTRNLVNTLLYNPCPTGATNCITSGANTFAASGIPYYATAAGQSLIAAAGINATYSVTVDGP